MASWNWLVGDSWVIRSLSDSEKELSVGEFAYWTHCEAMTPDVVPGSYPGSEGYSEFG